MTPAAFSAAFVGEDNEISAVIRERVAEWGGRVWEDGAAEADALFCVYTVDPDATTPSLGEGADWPLLETLKNRQASGNLPRYAVMVIAGSAPELVALIQAQFHYVTADTLAEDLHANIVYADYYRGSLTGAQQQTVTARFGDDSLTDAAAVAEAAVMLVTGLLDGMKAQVLPLRPALPAAEDVIAKG